MNLPECVIVKGALPGEDPNVEAYKNILNAVALNWKTMAPDGLGTIELSGNRLVLIIPLHTARLLTPPQVRDALKLVEKGAVLISEGITPLTEQLGFHSGKNISIRYLQELAYPDVEISWEKEAPVTPLRGPEKTIVLNRERDSGEPMVSLLAYGRGECLILAAELDPEKGEGYARFPYFHQELRIAGIEFPFRSERLSVFFDYAYRSNEDPRPLAAAWRRSGIRALHIGAWDFLGDDKTAEAYLRNLINACHCNGILVYAWLELPYVSDEFWIRHPGWREKTATGRDGHVDWRYLMDLKDPDCFKTVAAELERLLRRFEWDGVNLAELYFDSPAGPSEPDDFTPLNARVRSEFKRQYGMDPRELFNKGSRFYWKRNTDKWKQFVEYRVRQETELNERFICLFSRFRKSFMPSLDLIVTYVDNICDPSMREAVGADIGEVFRLLDNNDFSLVLEDPGTVWHLGPRRYAKLAGAYSKLTRNMNRLGIDINIVDRDVKAYPTGKQTGTEFLELFYCAGSNFQTVMAYAEQSMRPQDAELVSCALASGARAEPAAGGVEVHSPRPFIYRTGNRHADFSVDGNPWPCANGEEALLPAGSHLISLLDGVPADRPRLIRLNGNLLNAAYVGQNAIEFSYSARGHAIVIFSRVPESVQVGDEAQEAPESEWMMLPAGSHRVRAAF